MGGRLVGRLLPTPRLSYLGWAIIGRQARLRPLLRFRAILGSYAVEISRSTDATAFQVQNMTINHRRPNVIVTKEFLYCADVIARLDQIS